MFHQKLRKEAIRTYETTRARYEEVAVELNRQASLLYQEREQALLVVKRVEERINQLANSPKEFILTLRDIVAEVDHFREKTHDIERATFEAQVAAGGAGAGASLSALGIAVATMGPTAAMGIATTFGVASTGTAISSLSGAAATNAALAWLGGGALAAGGGGMSAGTALLGLAGPVGWTIAGVMFLTSIGSGVYASRKNKEVTRQLTAATQEIQMVTRQLEVTIGDIDVLIGVTKSQVAGLVSVEQGLIGNDYSQFSPNEKRQAGLLVNLTLALAQLINKEFKLSHD